ASSPMDSRFPDATNATPPRRACPARSLCFAALWSRCRLVPHSGQACQRTGSPLWTMTPQPQHVWLVEADGTAITEPPAHAALKLRMARNALHPASTMDLAR